MSKTIENNIRLIVGLGNPGKEYSGTRHNAGFWFSDELAKDCGVSFKKEAKFFANLCKINLNGHSAWLIKPTTFMNKSGQSVAAIAAYYKITPEEVLVIHDELDHDAGSARLKMSGGHAGHNGLRDIISALGTKDFLRLRLGIGHPGTKKQVVDFVLGTPSRDDDQKIRESIQDGLRVVDDLLAGSIQIAMNKLNSA